MIKKKKSLALMFLCLMFFMVCATMVTIPAMAEEPAENPDVVVDKPPVDKWELIWQDKILPALITFITTGGASAIVCAVITRGSKRQVKQTELVVTNGMAEQGSFTKQVQAQQSGISGELSKLNERIDQSQKQIQSMLNDQLVNDAKITALLDMANMAWGNSNLPADIRANLTAAYLNGKNYVTKAVSDAEGLMQSLKEKVAEITQFATPIVEKLVEHIPNKKPSSRG